MEDRLTPWTPSDINGSVRRSHQVQLTSIHRPYHQRQEQPNITVCVCTSKSKNGRDLLMDLSRQSGGWQLCDEGFVPLQTALAPAPETLLRIIRCSCLTDYSTVRRTCMKHNIECTPACGNCRGSGCTNSLQMACDDDRVDDNA